MESHPVVLSIAGSDCSGGAGIQADIKTISALGGYAASVITAVTVQNTLGISAIHTIPAEIVRGQIEAVMEDLKPDAVKIGMVYDIEAMQVIYDCLYKYEPEYTVYDPVMISTSGEKLMTDEAIEVMKDTLFNVINVLTPNILEATALTGIEIHNIADMQRAAQQLAEEYSILVLIKGGHLEGDEMCDIFQFADEFYHIFKEPKIESTNLHGTGCTLASAIATYRVTTEKNWKNAIRHAKAYVSKAILAGKDLNIGQGNGPLWHFPDSVAQKCTFCPIES